MSSNMIENVSLRRQICHFIIPTLEEANEQLTKINSMIFKVFAA